MDHDINSIFAVNDFSLAVDTLKYGLNKGRVNGPDMRSASEQAENFIQAIHGAKNHYKQYVKKHQEDVMRFKFALGATFSTLSIFQSLAILIPYNAGNLELSKVTPLPMTLAFCLAKEKGISYLINLNNPVSDKAAKAVEDARKEITNFLAPIHKIVTDYNNCVDQLTNGEYSQFNLKKINLDDLAEELKLDGVLADPELNKLLEERLAQHTEASSETISSRP
jgi:hypothetical protein